MSLETTQVSANNLSKTSDEIEAWLLNYLSQILSISPSEIALDLPLQSYGLDSAVAIALLAELSEYIGYDLDPELLFEYPTIASIANYCSGMEEIRI